MRRAHSVGGDTVLRLWRATLNSWAGLKVAARSEAAFREELVALALGIPLAFFITPLAWKRLALIGVILLLLAIELLNTAIEKLADRLTTDHDPKIGQVKDMGSAAVGVSLLMAGMFWIFALVERIGAI